MGSLPGNKEKILHCARKMFYLVGYHVTSVDDILNVCGVAKSNFYYHFKTKDELGVSVLHWQIEEFEAQALAALYRANQSPSERLRGFCSQLLYVQAEIHESGGCPFGNMAAALSNYKSDERSRRFRAILLEVFRQAEDALTVCLAEGAALGEFRTDVSASGLAVTLLAAVEGLLILTKTRQDTDTLRLGLEVIQKLVAVQ